MLNALIAELAASSDSAVQERMRVSTGVFKRFGIAWHPGHTELERTAANGSEPTPVSLPGERRIRPDSRIDPNGGR